MAPIIPLVLCGGSGSRLWPMSRLDRPKQFHPVAGGGEKTYFQATVARHTGPGFGEPIVVTGIDQAPMAKRQITDLECPAQILAEPQARNTGPAVLAAALLARRQDPDALLLTVPSDHIIDGDLNTPILAMRAAAEAGHIVCFGVVPRYAETGYGYVIDGGPVPEFAGARRAARFIEKPPADLARALVASGRAYWTSGISLFRADVLCTEYQRLDPTTYSAVTQAVAGAAPTHLGLFLDDKGFSRATDLPTEQAIFEQSDLLLLAPLEIGWNDIGAWNTVHGSTDKSPEGNVTNGDVIALDTQNSLIQSDNRLVAVVGMSDVIVIDTPDALLVTDKAHAQAVKSIVDVLKRNRRPELHMSAASDPRQAAEGFDHHIMPLSLAPGASARLPSPPTSTPTSTLASTPTGPESGYLVILTGTCRLIGKQGQKSLAPGQSVALASHAGWQVENRSSDPMQALVITPTKGLDRQRVAQTLGCSHA